MLISESLEIQVLTLTSGFFIMSSLWRNQAFWCESAFIWKDVFSKSFHALFVSFNIFFNCGMHMLIEDRKSIAFKDFVCYCELITSKFKILTDDEFLKILLPKDILLNTSSAKWAYLEFIL